MFMWTKECRVPRTHHCYYILASSIVVIFVMPAYEIYCAKI